MIIPSKCYSFITVSKKIRPNKDVIVWIKILCTLVWIFFNPFKSRRCISKSQSLTHILKDNKNSFMFVLILKVTTKVNVFI